MIVERSPSVLAIQVHTSWRRCKPGSRALRRSAAASPTGQQPSKRILEGAHTIPEARGPGTTHTAIREDDPLTTTVRYPDFSRRLSSLMYRPTAMDLGRSSCCCYCCYGSRTAFIAFERRWACSQSSRVGSRATTQGKSPSTGRNEGSKHGGAYACASSGPGCTPG